MDIITRVICLLRAQRDFGSRENYVDGPGGHQRQGEGSNDSIGGRQSASPKASIDPELAEYYANLEVPYGSDLATVRKAWKRLLRKYHPDLHSGDPKKRKVASELTQQLNRAYEQLAKRLAR
ncbi:J domain-containing protein [Acidobacteria bacterium AH-259-L09]|nr:J domain-containing protein [Acidobacteria bacterium AH-259-L09]